MTSPRTTRTLSGLMILALAATVALPAATALQFASAGNAAADAAAAMTSGATGGASTCQAGNACSRIGQDSAADGIVTSRTSASYAASADVNAQAAVAAAQNAAAQLRAEAQAKADELLALKNRVHADAAIHPEIHMAGNADAAWDTRAGASTGAGFDGIGAIGAGKTVDLQAEKAVKDEVKVQAKAKADGALDAIAQLLGELQGHVTAGVTAAVSAANGAGAAVGSALGLVQDTHVDVHQSIDVTGGLGAVPRVDIPQIAAPDLNVAGAASLTAQAQAAASGIIH